MPALDRKWWTLIAVCTATFMLLLDITVVNVALPDIQQSLHASFSDLQWVVDAYSLTLAAFLLTAGVAGDIYGRRKIFAIGLVVFSLASLTCGLSTTPLMLNLSRAVQGVGGAIMFATSLALIAAAFTGRDRGTAFGIYGAVIGGAVAIGPLIGGAITSGIGWRWIFFVNVPIGAIAVLITFTQIAKSEDLRVRRIDWVGFVTFSVSLFLLVFALVRGNDFGWGSTKTIGLARRRGRAHGGLLRQRAVHERPDVGPRPLQDPGLRRAVDDGLLPGRLHLRHVPLPDPLHSGQPGLRPAGRRYPLPAR